MRLRSSLTRKSQYEGFLDTDIRRQPGLDDPLDVTDDVLGGLAGAVEVTDVLLAAEDGDHNEDNVAADNADSDDDSDVTDANDVGDLPDECLASVLVSSETLVLLGEVPLEALAVQVEPEQN